MKQKQVVESDISCSLDIETKLPINGKFSVEYYDDFNIYLFIWTPSLSRPFDLSKCNYDESQVLFYLHQLISIHLSNNDSAENKLFIRFAIPKIPTTIRFIFHDKSIDRIMNVISILQSSQLISTNSIYLHIYNVNSNCTQQFKQTPNTLTLTQLQCFTTHDSIVSGLPKHSSEQIPLMVADFEAYVSKEDGSIMNYDDLHAKIFNCGIESDLRPFIWPYLFGFYKPEYSNQRKDEIKNVKMKEYALLVQQIDSFITMQVPFNKTRTIIYNDVLRTEKTDLFIEDDSPARKMLIRMLECYEIYNKDTGFVQGMCDLVRPFFSVFIKSISINTEKVILFDGTETDILSAESFLFWNVCNFFVLGGQDVMFSSMCEVQNFLAERAFSIAKSIHPLLGKWLISNNLSNLSFLLSPILLQFTRHFPSETLFSIWDIIYSADKPVAFMRFFAAALLFMLFPMIASSGQTECGDIIFLVSNTICKLNANDILRLAKQLYANSKEDPSQSKWYFMDNPAVHKKVEYFPKYFKLLQINELY